MTCCGTFVHAVCSAELQCWLYHDRLDACSQLGGCVTVHTTICSCLYSRQVTPAGRAGRRNADQIDRLNLAFQTHHCTSLAPVSGRLVLMMPHSRLTRILVQAPSDSSRNTSAQPSPTPSKAPTLAPYAPVSSPSLELQSEGVQMTPLYPRP